MVAESWFHNIWRTSQKHSKVHEKQVIGVLAFEVASLMSKLVHLWQSLGDKQVKKLREDISSSIGIKKLISDDEDYIVQLIRAEMVENLGNVAEAVARLGNKCSDCNMNNLDKIFDSLFKFGVGMEGLVFTWKKMEQTVKKMQKLITVNASLYQEWETLTEFEQTLKRMSSYSESDSKTILEYQNKVAWKRHEVRDLREKSLWNKAYEDTVMLMTRSIFTVFGRIKHVFGLDYFEDTMEQIDSTLFYSGYIHQSQSVSSVLLQSSSVHPSESGIPRFASGPLPKKLTTQAGPLLKANKGCDSYSGPLMSKGTKSSSIHRTNKTLNSYSGPLVKASLPNSSSVPRRSIFGLKLWRRRGNSSTIDQKLSILQSNHLTSAKTHAGELAIGNSVEKDLNSKSKLLDAPPETLGGAALALHYANVIIVIEKLVASPHLIGHDARDDLYKMLPTSLRASIRKKLKPFSRTLDSCVNNKALVREWNEAMTRILEWLSPLAHNTIKWQSERSYEQQSLSNRANMLLVQTLHFVNQEKAEDVITELLVGLNYVWRFGREVSAEAFLECASTTKLCDYLCEAP